jgi:phosphopantothenoylcysteine decarboxylase / phosphopantothenate---cysteine ligase
MVGKMIFKNMNILLGVTGGIAAYKAVEVLRLLKKAGANVNVIMTDSAQKFVSKRTFEVLSENPVLSDHYFDTETSVKHIELAQKAQAVVIAPATANTIAKFAQGIADNALTTTLLAVTCPVMICPSMNTNMYQNLKVQRNLDVLENDGWHILDPDSGFLACKTTGAGRLPDSVVIVDRIEAMLTKKDFKGKKILISAGPTVEAIDPVRFVSNYSSGKMGYAVAEMAEKRGAEVILVSGPVCLDSPFGVTRISVESADDMLREMLVHMNAVDIIIKVAAVADYRPVNPKPDKIKKKDNSGSLLLEMEETTDILMAIGQKKRADQFLVGFAAETHDLKKNALAKISKKNLDMIAANQVGQAGSGFKADTNKLTLYFKDGSFTDIPLADKKQVANILLSCILEKMGDWIHVTI